MTSDDPSTAATAATAMPTAMPTSMPTPQQLRAQIVQLVRGLVPDTIRVFDENRHIRGRALEHGYIRIALTIEPADQLLGAVQPVSGDAALVVAAPYGSGMGPGDAVLAALARGLSYQQKGALRFGGLAIATGRQAGGLWLTDASISLTAWPTRRTDDAHP